MPYDIEPRLLRAFVAVAEEPHVTRAVTRLLTAQHALGRDVRRLRRLSTGPRRACVCRRAAAGPNPGCDEETVEGLRRVWAPHSGACRSPWSSMPVSRSVRASSGPRRRPARPVGGQTGAAR
ncbi:hypothetical protein BLA24_08085 [Streptomyces cinnamoneus]|uniref:LysR family transcriptional regulator n=1 Tax=Streptomyces cinnamoneus TaxID=53446 RepID=A0A2G1XMB9_STRCJ|nr:hypothetical protein BLA24_08085 [Streptomyces cinnamoneus]